MVIYLSSLPKWEIFCRSDVRLSLSTFGTIEYRCRNSKGTQTIRDTDKRLQQRNDLNYIGFLESDKLMNHMADVIVCDGFTGNIALKAVEGAAKIFFHYSSAPLKVLLFAKVLNVIYYELFLSFLSEIATNQSGSPQWGNLTRIIFCGCKKPWRSKR
ncbi:phosphate acyltransferase [Actinobacillus equuli]|nr:phosphate acyltransferase [Actinobacillus equuli]